MTTINIIGLVGMLASVINGWIALLSENWHGAAGWFIASLLAGAVYCFDKGAGR